MNYFVLINAHIRTKDATLTLGKFIELPFRPVIGDIYYVPFEENFNLIFKVGELSYDLKNEYFRACMSEEVRTFESFNSNYIYVRAKENGWDHCYRGVDYPNGYKLYIEKK